MFILMKQIDQLIGTYQEGKNESGEDSNGCHGRTLDLIKLQGKQNNGEDEGH